MNLGKENEQIKFKESTSELSDALIDLNCAIFTKTEKLRSISLVK